MCRLSNGGTNGSTADIDTNWSNDPRCPRRVSVRSSSPEFGELCAVSKSAYSGRFSREDEAVSPASLHTPAGVTWFTFNSGVRDDGIRTRITPSFVYFFRGFEFSPSGFRQVEEMRPAASGTAFKFDEYVPIEGMYVMGTLFAHGPGADRAASGSSDRPAGALRPPATVGDVSRCVGIGRACFPFAKSATGAFRPGLATLACATTISEQRNAPRS